MLVRASYKRNFLWEPFNHEVDKAHQENVSANFSLKCFFLINGLSIGWSQVSHEVLESVSLNHCFKKSDWVFKGAIEKDKSKWKK